MRMDFVKAIGAQGDTFLKPGSEFCSPACLAKLLQGHGRWIKLKRIISTGAVYTFKENTDISEETRLQDLVGDIRRGNNASTKIPGNNAALMKSYTSEVEKGWLIPFLREDALIAQEPA